MSMCLHKPSPLLRARGVEAVEKTGAAQDAIDRRWAGGKNVGIKSHEGQTPIAFQRVLFVELNNGTAFLWLKPMIARYLAVVFVDLAVARFPVVELALRNPKPDGETKVWNFCGGGPTCDEVYNLIARIMGNPAIRQGSPSAFLAPLAELRAI